MSLIQSKSQQGTQDGSVVITVAFTSNNTAGNIIVAFCGNETDSTTSTLSPSISDNNFNTYNQIDQAFSYASGSSPFNYSDAVTMWWAKSIASGANTVSFDFSACTNNPGNFNSRAYSIVIAEFPPAASLNGHNHGAGNSATADPGNVTSSGANSLFLSGASIANSVTCTISTPTNYTSIASDTNGGAGSTVIAYNFAYYLNNGTKDGSFPLSPSTPWGAVAGVVSIPFTANQSSYFLMFP